MDFCAPEGDLSDGGMKMLSAHYAAVTKQEEYEKIRRVVRMFGKDGATLPDVCGTFGIIYGHEMDQLLLRELISHCQVIQIPNTGRIMDSENYFESMHELVDEQF